jgi:predicted DNA-binding mobile mystery protein A
MARKTSNDNSFNARLAFDEHWPALRKAANLMTRPRGGWSSAIRTALGMSASDLAKRLGVTPSTVLRLEANEKAGKVNLESLVNLAGALECDLVYAFVPRVQLDQIVTNQARQIASAELRDVQTTMELEEQGLPSTVLAKQLDKRTQELVNSRDLWK